jgi:hypothetical protein
LDACARLKLLQGTFQVVRVVRAAGLFCKERASYETALQVPRVKEGHLSFPAEKPIASSSSRLKCYLWEELGPEAASREQTMRPQGTQFKGRPILHRKQPQPTTLCLQALPELTEFHSNSRSTTATIPISQMRKLRPRGKVTC